MQIKPIKLIKPVSQSQIGPEDDIVRKPTNAQIKADGESSESNGFSLAQRSLVFQGKDVGKMITEAAQLNPQVLSQMANELEKFKKARLQKRNNAIKKNGKVIEAEEEELGLIYALCDAHITRISQLIKKKYEQTKDGLLVFFDEEGQLIVNGLNINALIEQCRQNPTPKSKVLLKGWKTRLSHILHNRSGNPYYTQIREIVLELSEEIEALLS